MATTIETVSVKVEADTTSAQSKLKTLGKTVNENKAAFAAAGVAIAAAGVAVGKAAQFVKGSIDLWTIQEKAIQKNESALAAWGRDVTYSSARLQRFASEMQSATNIGDELILNLTGTALAMGKTVTEAEEAARASAGLSEAMGIDLNTALKAVTNAQDGNFSQLQRYIPSLRVVTDESEKWELINTAVASGLDTLAESTDTMAGKTTRLSNAWGDFREEFGRGFGVGENSLIERLSSGIEGATELWKGLNDQYEQVNEQMAKGANLAGISSRDFRNWNAENARGAGILAYLNEELADTVEIVEELNEMWEPERPRAYWEEYAEGLKLQYGGLTELERIEVMRANAIKDTATEYADLNAEIEEMINNFYDAEVANILAAQAQEVEDAYIEYARIRQAEHDKELARIATESQARKALALEMTASYQRAFSNIGGFISTMFGIQAQGLEEGSKAQQKALRKQAIAEKATAVFNSLIATSVAIVKALPNIPLSIASGIAGAAQTAGILATPIPSFATGTSPSGYTVPPGFENDNFPVKAKTGETVHVERKGASLTPTYIINKIQVGAYEFGDMITKLGEDRMYTVPKGIVA